MSEQTDDDVRREALAADAAERIKRGQHWTDWMLVADGLMVGRIKAMYAAGTNVPKGKGYGRAMKEWLDPRPWAREIDNPTRDSLFWCAKNRSEIEIWRDTLAQNDRARLNHPTAMRRRYEASHRIKDKDDENGNEKKKKETAKEAYLREIAEKDAEIAQLKQQLRNGGSLFDLHKSPLKFIGKVISENMDIDRMKQLQKEIAKQIADRKAKLTTAQAG